MPVIFQTRCKLRVLRAKLLSNCIIVLDLTFFMLRASSSFLFLEIIKCSTFSDLDSPSAKG